MALRGTMTWGRRAALGASSLVVAGALVGCGGGSSDAGGDEGRDGETSTTATTTTTTPVRAAVDFSDPSVAVIAHRGASGYAPEHTFAAYDLAVAQDADYLEQDLQLTKDGDLVVLHDPTLDRTMRGPAESCSGPVADKTLAQLQDCDAGSWFNEAYPDQADPAFEDLGIPTLDEVFERYGNDVRYYIELKAPGEQPGIEDALLDLLDGLDGKAGDAALPPVVIQSFSTESLQQIHERRPDLPLVQLWPANGPALDAAALDEIASYAVAIGPSKELVDEELVAAANESCLDVHPYTVNEPDEMAALLAAGVGGMFTNTPDVAAKARAKATPPKALCAAPAAAG